MLTFFVEGNPQLAHLILDSFLVGLEEADLLRVALIVLALLPYRESSPVKGLLLHVEAFDLLLQLIIKVLDLGVLLLKLCLALLELALLHGKVSAAILCVVKLLAQLNLCLIHLLAEVTSAHLYLLELDLELLAALDRFLLLLLRHIANPFFVGCGPLNLDLEVDGAVPDLAVQAPSGRFLLLDVCEDLLLLLLVLIVCLLLSLGQLGLLSRDPAPSCVQSQSLLLEDAAALRQSRLLLEYSRLSLPQLALLLR